jgi:hypothetical protein
MLDHYYQVVTWTAADRYDDNREEMQAIVQKFGPDQR